LKYRFLDLTLVSFWTGQDAENDFTVRGDQLNHYFLDLIQVATWTVQEAENEIAAPGDLLK